MKLQNQSFYFYKFLEIFIKNQKLNQYSLQVPLPGIPSSLVNTPCGPITVTSTPSGQSIYTCPICGFSSASKFHFNSHMNTHTDHQCTMCDYTARTEGRLKRHMKESHSREEQAEAGLSPLPLPPPPMGLAGLNGHAFEALSAGAALGDMNALQQMQVILWKLELGGLW